MMHGVRKIKWELGLQILNVFLQRSMGEMGIYMIILRMIWDTNPSSNILFSVFKIAIA